MSKGSPVQTVISAQTDFSGGELDPTIKRADQDKQISAARAAGARQMSNFRILNTGGARNRCGRRALFLESGRVDQVLMSPGNVFYIAFGAGTLRVYNSSGAQVFTQSGFLWAVATIAQIDWAVVQNSIYIVFPGQVPKVLSWDGVATWSVANYAERVSTGGQKRTAFYRVAPKDITLTPSGATGNVNIVFSSSYLVAGMVGKRLRYGGRQLTITGVSSGTFGQAIVNEALLGGQQLSFISTINGPGGWSVGDVIQDAISGAQGIIVSFASATSCYVSLLTAAIFRPVGAVSNVIGPTAVFGMNGADPIPPPASTVWDEEVLTDSYRGYPRGVFTDQNRLGFCDLPSVPNGIVWSAIADPTDCYVTAQPSGAIFEIVPRKSQVLYVVAGPEGSEFVFCDNAVYYIPISVTNPLRPGSVAFNLISGDGCAAVKPRPVQETIVYVNAGSTNIAALVAVGSYSRPFESRNLTDIDNHLINSPVAIAAPTADAPFPERYIYILNGDGTLTVGKYDVKNGQIDGLVGWVPHSGAGTIKWASARSMNVFFTTTYAPNAIAPVSVVEVLDDDQYLDAALLVNALPAAFTPPVGKGPLWWMPGGAVDLMDQTTRSLGTYQIDADGFIIPQFHGGEDLTALTLVAGQAWTGRLEPFVPPVPGGQDGLQRMRKRAVPLATVHVINSTGFLWQSIRNGVAWRERRIPAFDMTDDATLAPPLRERAYGFRAVGRDHDPRRVIVKDTPGPLTILEIGMEASV